MSETIAVQMHINDAAGLGRIRQRSDVDICECPDAIWVRIQKNTEEWDAAILKLPGRRFSVLPDEQLVPYGALVPYGYLPNGPWIALAKWMSVQTDSAAFSGQLNCKIELRLVRGGPIYEPNVIVTHIDSWLDYVAHAPQIRIDQLAFAMNSEGLVVVRGTPLPPLKGVRYVERSGVATEAGWIWAPPIQPDVLSAVLGLAVDDIALFHAIDSWERIRGDDFVSTTRSAVRLSAGADPDV